MRSFMSRNPIPMAVVALGLTAATTGVAFNLNKLPLVGEGPMYRAVFADASGLTKDEQVRVAGIKVGRVSRIALEGDHVIVSFHVKGVPLGEDTTASIEIKTMLGQHYLAINPAGPGRLAAGSEIPLEHTTVPTNIVPALQDLTDIAETTDTAALEAAFRTMAESLDTAAPEIGATLTGLSRLSRTIASRDHELGQLLTHARGLTTTIANQRGSLDQIIKASDQVLGMLADRRDVIREIVVGTNQLATQIRGIVGDNAKSIGPTLAKLQEVQTILDKDLKQLDQALVALPAYFKVMTNVVGSGRWFDSVVTAPTGLKLCDNGAGPLSSIVDPLLTTLSASAGSSGPCIPLAPTSQKGTP